MDEIKNMLISMHQDIKQQKQDMLEMKEDIKSKIINSLSEKFNNLELKNELLEKKIKEQSNKINNLERQCRRKNLILFGVEETEKSYDELEKMKQSSKRNLSESPEKLHPVNQNVQQTSKQPPKKNKGDMKNYITQKPKLILAHTESTQRQSKTSEYNTE
ncbi:unnamed protein product [Parnassius apollo]|uniref:(apollo) hypothetical protein n=1 Tax=Parnassius apollo TaxID=110799 RepID=A0A8S3WWM0_PARAO|nr:unnamed protein product [Parnassius apollo]